MHLTKEEERALDGEYGEAMETAYRVLLSIGKMSDATHLIPISSAHISGVSYSTIGKHGREFLEMMGREDKVVVPTSVNPVGIDPSQTLNFTIREEYIMEQARIMKAYRSLGIIESFTCTPYEELPMPPIGTHVSWAETSALIYANSILGLKTNRESALTSLASAITGKTPYSELHLDEMRRPTLQITVKAQLSGSLRFGLLGYLAGKMSRGPIALKGVKGPSPQEVKALCASMGTSGASGLFLLDYDGECEGVEVDDEDLRRTYDDLSSTEGGDVIVLGCPHPGIGELSDLAAMVEGKRFNRRCLIFCSKRIYEEAKGLGIASKIEGAGAQFVYNACAVFNPIFSSLGADGIMTDSCKAAHYIKRGQGIDVTLKGLSEIIAEGCRS